LDTVEGSALPSTLADAMLLPGTVQWKAKEGAYVVPTLNSNELVAGPDQTVQIVRFDSSDSSATGVFTQAIGQIPTTSGVNFGAFTASGTGLSDFNFGGAYFSGLSQSTTLTVNIIRYFERFPSIDFAQDLPLVVLATPSCRNDPQAQELYSAVIRHMPVGVPQRFNGIGDWFKEAAQTARDMIAPVLSAIPLPMAQMGASILNGIGGNLVKKYSNEEQKAVVVPGKVYNAQGNQSMVVVPKKKKAVTASVSKQLASLGLKKKKKKTPSKVAPMAK